MSVELWWKEDGLLVAHLSLLGHISGELGLDEVSDFISWEECPKSGVFWAPETLSLRAQRDRLHKLYKSLKRMVKLYYLTPNINCESGRCSTGTTTSMTNLPPCSALGLALRCRVQAREQP